MRACMCVCVCVCVSVCMPRVCVRGILKEKHLLNFVKYRDSQWEGEKDACVGTVPQLITIRNRAKEKHVQYR